MGSCYHLFCESSRVPADNQLPSRTCHVTVELLVEKWRAKTIRVSLDIYFKGILLKSSALNTFICSAGYKLFNFISWAVSLVQDEKSCVICAQTSQLFSHRKGKGRAILSQSC